MQVLPDRQPAGAVGVHPAADILGNRRPRLHVGGEDRAGLVVGAYEARPYAVERCVPRVASNNGEPDASGAALWLEHGLVVTVDQRLKRTRRGRPAPDNGCASNIALDYYTATATPHRDGPRNENRSPPRQHVNLRGWNGYLSGVTPSPTGGGCGCQSVFANQSDERPSPREVELMPQAKTKSRPATKKAAASRKRSRAPSKPKGRSPIERPADLSEDLFKSLEDRARTAIDAVREFLDTVDRTLPTHGEGQSKREEITDSALQMAERLVHTQYEFLRRVVDSAGKSVTGSHTRK